MTDKFERAVQSADEMSVSELVVALRHLRDNTKVDPSVEGFAVFFEAAARRLEALDGV